MIDTRKLGQILVNAANNGRSNGIPSHEVCNLLAIPATPANKEAVKRASEALSGAGGWFFYVARKKGICWSRNQNDGLGASSQPHSSQNNNSDDSDFSPEYLDAKRELERKQEEARRELEKKFALTNKAWREYKRTSISSSFN